MKKIRYTLSVVMFIYSDLATGGSAVYFGFSGEQKDADILNTQSGQLISVPVRLQALGGTGTVLGTPECNGVSWINYYTAYFHRIGVPKTINVGGVWVPVQVEAPFYQRDTDASNYYYLKSYNNNGGHGFWYSGKACWYTGETANVNAFAPGTPPDITLHFRIPPNLPDGLTRLVIPVKYGKNVNFTTTLADWWHAGDSMNAHSTIDADNTHFLQYTRDIINKARCSFDKDVYNIDHGNVNIEHALSGKSIASINVKVNCTTPTDIKIKLSTSVSPNYQHNQFAVNIGNGWDSVISINSFAHNNIAPQNIYVTQSGRIINIASTIYGESSHVRAGSINGSMVMTFDFQ
ncbi:PapG chaperone-binding domain-containing protein [Escherichia coli]